MSEKESVFRGNREDLSSVDLEAPLRDVRAGVCEFYRSAYGKAALTAQEEGLHQVAEIYHFLNNLASFYLAFGDPAKPFRPMRIGDGTRSLLPEDLAPADYPVVRNLAERITDPSLRARLFDVLWLEEHDHQDCSEAAASYLDSALSLDTDENWTFAVTQFHRGLLLSQRLGRKQTSFLDIARALILAVERDSDTEEGFRTCQLLYLASEFGVGDQSALADLARQVGDRASERGEHRNARHYWRMEVQFLRRSKDETNELVAAQRAAETYVLEAAERATGKMASHLAAASLLKKGIEALRRSKADPLRIKELRATLAEYQKKSLDEMQSFETSLDLTDMAEAAKAHVGGHSLFDAIQRLALGYSLTDVGELKNQVIESAKEAPLQHLFGGSILDDAGRSTVEQPGLLNLEGEEAEKALEAEMFTHAARYQWGVRRVGFIQPARIRILNEHRLNIQDLGFLVRNNPFVPPGHEGIFLRGIHAGFHGDFLVAAHLLVPQIENSIRFVLIQNGVDVSNLKSDGTQPLKVLGPLFDIPESKEVFGESFHFELRGMLIEKTGHGFRDQLAHGFSTEGDCYGDAAVNLWWLALRLCVILVLRATQSNQSGNQKP